jgi:flagellar basal body-associated protein FliL
LRHRDPIAYAKFKSIVIANQTFSIKTNISVQVASEDKHWLDANQAALESVLRNTLAETDPKVATGPNGLITLQETLKNASNSAFHTNRIENVYFTDFILVPTGSQ